MLTEIAAQPGGFWQGADDEVNGRISQIVERYALRDEARALLADRPTAAGTASLAHRSHNMPPDLSDVQPHIIHHTTIVWAGLEEASEELECRDVDKPKLAKTAHGLLFALDYCGVVANTAIESGAKVIGAAGGTMVLDQVFNSGRVLGFANRLLHWATSGL